MASNESSGSSWLTSAAPLIGAGIDFVSGLGSSIFGMNQARKNRAFQERMYNKQVEDNLRFWNLNNDYNLPINVLKRLEDAGLNPLLMYEGGASALTSSAPASGGTAPSGDSARGDMRSNFAYAAAQSALINAQIRNIEADTQGKLAAAGQAESTTKNLEFDLMFKKLNQEVDKALKHANLDQLFAATDNLRQQAYSTGQLTLQSVLTMMQAREYVVKRFNLDAETIGEQLKQRWYELQSGRIVANASMKSAFAAALNASANWNLSNAQVGQIALNMSQSREMFPLLKENQENVNWSQVQDRIFKGVEISNAQKDGFMKEIENRLKVAGMGTDTYIYKFAAPWVLPMIRGDYKYSTSNYLQ